MKANDAYMAYVQNPCVDTYEQLGEALIQYIKGIIASSYGRSYNFMEDAIGETTRKVLENLDAFQANKEEGKGNFATWVYVLARNTCVDIARFHNRRQEQRSDLSEVPVVDTSYINKLALRSLINKLSVEDQLLARFKLEKATNEEIAVELNCSVQAVKSKWNRVLERLKEI